MHSHYAHEGQLANLGARLRAALLDGVVCFGGALLVALAWGDRFAATSPDGAHTVGVSLGGSGTLGLLTAVLLYFTLCEGHWGATLGKRALGLRVVTETGNRIGIRRALIRNLLRLVDGLFFYVLGGILAALSPKRQRIGDRVAGTLVVKEPRRPSFRVDSALS